NIHMMFNKSTDIMRIIILFFLPDSIKRLICCAKVLKKHLVQPILTDELSNNPNLLLLNLHERHFLYYTGEKLFCYYCQVYGTMVPTALHSSAIGVAQIIYEQIKKQGG
ncbi:MAG: hypothetical protein LUD02_15455, partial [Tannerellaceae bacterium]|nr:hypothetical protein [Tannerellaceae bacterium]